MNIERKVKDTIKKYKLLSKKDKIIVALSGGKDSTAAAYILKKLGYSIEGLTIDLEIGDYSKKNLELVKKFCNEQGIKLHVVRMKDRIGYSICYIRSVLRKKYGLKSCTVCGVIKRYMLNLLAKEFKADKIVTGHNLEDEAEAIMMNFFKCHHHLLSRLGPISGLKRHERFVKKVKPLYLCSEKEVKAYSKKMKFNVNYDPCPCRVEAFRRFIDRVLESEERRNPKIKENIVLSLLHFLPKLKEKYNKAAEISTCESCGEPTTNKVCYTCVLLGGLKK